jgi:hypothetical protein
MSLKIVMKAGHGGSSRNPSYSGDDDQEDHGLKPAQAKSLQHPHLKQ